MIASALIVQAAIQTADEDYDRISEADWIRYLNSAMQQLVLVRPDTNPVIEAFQLSAGTKQAIPSGKIRFIDIVRNLGATGSDPGLPISMISMADMDAYNPGWHDETAMTSIDHYMFDFKKPKEFFVYPPVHAVTAVYVEMACSEIPTAITAVGNTVSVEEIFENPLLDWMLYRAFCLDADSDVNWAKGLHHQGAFYQALGVELKSGGMVAPREGSS